MLFESIGFALAALWAHKLRAILTSLGMVIGNASVIIVATVALTGRGFVLRLIEGVGSNLIYAYYEPGGHATGEQQIDFINLDDVEAVRRQLGERAAVAGVVKIYDRRLFGGEIRQVAVLGSNTEYRIVRHLTILAGRFFDEEELVARRLVCLLTGDFATLLYGSPRNALGNTINVLGRRFTIIGVFREGVETFGQSEISGQSVLIPISVMRYFTQVLRVDPLYVSARKSSEVESATAQVREILESRHRPGLYKVENLRSLLSAARQISSGLTIVLFLVSAIALTISGIFIMNIMLVTVTERTREIGIRMAVGATRRQILYHFLVEAGSISVVGGIVGILVGVCVPLIARHFITTVDIPISVLSVLAALFVSFSVGVVFGLLPASRAARLNPTEALRYE